MAFIVRDLVRFLEKRDADADKNVGTISRGYSTMTMRDLIR